MEQVYRDWTKYFNLRCRCSPQVQKLPQGCGCGKCEICGGFTFCKNSNLYDQDILIIKKEK